MNPSFAFVLTGAAGVPATAAGAGEPGDRRLAPRRSPGVEEAAQARLEGLGVDSGKREMM